MWKASRAEHQDTIGKNQAAALAAAVGPPGDVTSIVIPGGIQFALE
jgi:hypothetical protein